MRNIFLVLLSSILITACGFNPKAIKKLAVADAKENTPIDGSAASCGSMGLTKKCNIWSGAEQIIAIDGHKLRFGADDLGKTIMIMTDKESCGTTDTWCQTPHNNRNYGLVKKYLNEKNINILSAQAMAVSEIIMGYVIRTDKDAFTPLMELAVEN